jgi:benzoyl-CoA reductase/2-hydroxyglutaryl-CoA dehydratase subunit BcrC/BadD/HgdB
MTEITSSLKRLKSTETFVNLTRAFNDEVWAAKRRGEKIAWVTSTTPVEILHAMDIRFSFPEQQGMTTTIEGHALPYLEAADAEGYSAGMCPYARITLGEGLLGRPQNFPNGTAGGMPSPDFLLSIRGCGPFPYWWAQHERQYQVPLFIGDRMVGSRPLEEHDIRYETAMNQDLISFIEEVTGKKLDPDRYGSCQKILMETFTLMLQVLELNKNIPAPLDEMEFMVTLAAFGPLRGSDSPDFDVKKAYSNMLREVKDRVDNKIGALKNERFRLFFDSNPPWDRYLWISDYLADRGAVFVTSTFNQVLSSPWMHCGLKGRLDYLERLMKDYHVDAAIIMNNPGCKLIAYSMYDIRIALQKMGIPCLFFDGNQADPRYFKEDQFNEKVDAFLEMLEEKKYG